MDKSTFRSLTYGVFVLGANVDGRLCGCIVNTVIQASSETPMVALSLNKSCYTSEAIKKTGKFSVSILSEKSPASLIQAFGFSSGRDRDKFAGISHEKTASGLPKILENCCGYIECEITGTLDAGTHDLILARVTEAVPGESGLIPMTYRFYHEVIRGSAPKSAPTYQEKTPEPKAPAESAIEPAPHSVKTAPAQKPLRYVCDVCGYVYEGDITKEPDDYTCPVCGATKDHFIKEE